jgi:predicted ribosomally synthesized peptide with SipW-like signal peptide
MLRGTLLSLLTIGAVAFIVGSATFAPFSDSGDATGSVSAGTLQIAINEDDTPDPATFTFSTPAFCPDNMAVNDSCTADLTITNVGTLAGDIVSWNAWIESVSPENECTGQPEEPETEADYNWTVALAGPVDGEDEVNELAELLLPNSIGDSAVFTVTVTLDEITGTEPPDINDCQDSTAVVIVRIVVEQSSTPHAESDTGL